MNCVVAAIVVDGVAPVTGAVRVIADVVIVVGAGAPVAGNTAVITPVFSGLVTDVAPATAK